LQLKYILHRYWFEFDIPSGLACPPGIGFGCGVSAFDYTDAIDQIKKKVFKEIEIPSITKYVKNIDVSNLDGHIKPNMESPAKRGIWFPLGYD